MQSLGNMEDRFKRFDSDNEDEDDKWVKFIHKIDLKLRSSSFSNS